MRAGTSWIPAVAACSALVFAASPTFAQCQSEPRLQNYTGSGATVCACFLQGEQAGVVLDAPAGDYPIEILRVGIGWYSQFGGAPDSLEQAIHIYGAGLPDPGPLKTVVVLAHLALLPLAALLDRAAHPLQAAGLPFLIQDMPTIVSD